MPGIRLTLPIVPDPEFARRLAEVVTEIVCSELRKEPERTMVMIAHVPDHAWFVAGRSLRELDQTSFRLEVTITDETCTKAQKATFAEVAFAALSTLLGGVHPLSNIHVVDCRAAAYSYGGITQERHAFGAAGTHNSAQEISQSAA
jgi:4-oxalocrotonate tautomerase